MLSFRVMMRAKSSALTQVRRKETSEKTEMAGFVQPKSLIKRLIYMESAWHIALRRNSNANNM